MPMNASNNGSLPPAGQQQATRQQALVCRTASVVHLSTLLLLAVSGPLSRSRLLLAGKFCTRGRAFHRTP